MTCDDIVNGSNKLLLFKSYLTTFPDQVWLQFYETLTRKFDKR